MLRQALVSAVIAGALAGVLVSGLQAIRVVPLILKAEIYESASDSAPAATETATEPHHHGEEIIAAGAWAPEEGLERTFYTVFTNILTAIAFALLLTV
ncbi:MAG: cobalt transporter, partial [Rhodospirillaceae bacterium]|nr:cobalt transporter [Rhodospirillaceae bacterium]